MAGSFAAFVLALAASFQEAPVRSAAAPAQPAASVQIDAVAADARGRVVPDLRPEDFELRENGAPRPIDSVRFVAGEPRLFGIFLDEYHISPGAPALAARDAIARLVERHLGPGDRALVVKPLDSLVTLRLSAERADILAAIATFEGRKGEYSPRNAFERQFIAGDASRIDATRAQIAASALNAIVTQLGAAADGRKTLVVVSEGFVQRPRGRGEEPLPTADTVVRSAIRAGVSIYTLHPRAFTALASVAPDAAPLETMKALAAETGGTAIFDPADAGTRLEQIVHDASGYYLIGFQSGAKRDGGTRFQPVEMRVKRPGVQLRARKGYWTPLPEDVVRARAAAREAAVRRPPELPRRTSPLIRPWFGLARGSDGHTRVRFVWEPAGRLPGDRSRALPPAQITLKALAPDGTAVFEGVVRPGTAETAFEARPGRLRVQMAIEDASARVLDTDVRDVAVASFAAPAAIGSAEVYRARNAREFRAAAQGHAVPSAVREFSRTERLLIRFPVYASAGGARVSARLVSRLGSVLRELPVSSGGDLHQVDLPLAGLAAGEYRVELTLNTPSGDAREAIIFRVTT
jgi:VWFA-related protein